MSAPERRRERKVVTVLFADLVGFTARAESLDPEDVEEILAPYHERLRTELERFGGTVEKFIGDAVMAVFGAPVAHEDDAERAVRAALAIRDWALDQDGVELRIAVNTGEALVNLGARPQEGEPIVTGDVVNTAARMQSAAPVNGVLVGEATRRVTDGVVEYRELEPIDAKGKSAPVRVWEAVAARSRFGVDVVHGGAPLVGRDGELRLLVDALARAREAREPQLVTVVGVPGIGKSRLVYELMQAAAAAPELTRWRQGRCLPYGDGVTFWALGEIVKSQAGIFETDEAERADDKLAAMLEELVAEAGERAWLATHLRPLVGLAAERIAAEDTEAETFAAWIRFFELLADETPLVLVIEDLHWADERLLDFVDELVEPATDAGILVVATARPELLERRTNWGGGKPNAFTLSLAPLADDDVARILATLLERSVLPAEDQQALLARAGGNPLFAEQYARMLAEREGADELPVPHSVQGIIAARLDALAPEEKTLLQNASVHGKVFWVGAVAAMSDGAQLEAPLRALERKEFLRRQRRSSVAGETEYTFRHILLRDVAYAQIPRAERAERHRRAAEWIESLGEGRDDHVELLADHYLRALELSRAARREAPGLERRAALALRDAGARAVVLNAFSAAARYVDRALELFAEDDPERTQVLAMRARALYFVGAEDAIELLDDASAALVAAGDPDAAAELEALTAEACWYRGDGRRVFEHLDRAQALVADAPVSPAKARVATRVARYRALGGHARSAFAIASEALTMAEQVGDTELQVHALNTVGISSSRLGDYDAALATLERALELALAANSPQAATVYNNLATVLGNTREVERAREASREADRVLARYEDRQQARFRRMNAAGYHYVQGEWDDAMAVLDAFIAEAEAGSPHRGEAVTRAVRAEIRLGRGDEIGALDDVERAIARARVTEDPQVIVSVFAEAAHVYVRLGRADQARALVRELLDSHRDVACTHGAVQVWLPLLAADVGLERETAEFLREAPESLYTAAGRAVVARDWERAAALGSEGFLIGVAMIGLHAARDCAEHDRHEEVAEHLSHALPFFRKARATRYLREAEALLAESAPAA